MAGFFQGISTGKWLDLQVSNDLGKFHHDLTSRPSPGIMVSKGNHSQMALIQVSELL